jgi:hypothetical protein
MATITATEILESGTTSSLSACTSAGDDFRNSGVEFIRIENQHASTSYKVKVASQSASIDHPNWGILSKLDVEKEVSAGQTAYLGPFKQRAFDDSDGSVQITYTVTSNGAAISTISSGVHALKIEVLYLKQSLY